MPTVVNCLPVAGSTTKRSSALPGTHSPSKIFDSHTGSFSKLVMAAPR